MTGLETASPKKGATGWGGFEPPNRTVMDAFNHASYFPKEPEIGFGTGSRLSEYFLVGYWIFIKNVFFFEDLR